MNWLMAYPRRWLTLCCVFTVLSVCLPVVAATDDLDRQLEQALTVFNTGDLDRSQMLYQKIIGSYPEQPSAYYQLGVILIRKNIIEEGIRNIEKAASLEPGNVTFHIALASMYEFVGNFESAISQLDQVLKLVPDGSKEYLESSRKKRFLVASNHAKQGELKTAIDQFKEQIRDYPDDYLLYYSLGIAYLLLNDYGNAEQALKTTIQLNPRYVNSYMSLATAYESSGDMLRAYEMLDEVASGNFDPANAARARVRMKLIEARLLLDEGNRREAQEAYEQILESDPDNVQVLLLAADLYEQNGDIASELRTYEHLIEVSPDNLDVRLKLAGKYLALKQVGPAIDQLDEVLIRGDGTKYQHQAEELLSRVMNTAAGRELASKQRQRKLEQFRSEIRQHPDDVAAHFRLGRIYYQESNYQDALSEFERVHELDPANKRIYVNLASTQGKLEHYVLAAENYARAIAYEEDAKIVTVLVRQLLLNVGRQQYMDSNYEQAGQIFSQLIDMEPGNYEARLEAGRVYYARGLYLNAIDAFQRVIQLVPGHLGARLSLALSYEKLNREEEAINEYRDLLRYKPPAGMAQMVTERMDAAERRIRGLSLGAGYLLSYDSNSNLSDTDPLSEARTDLSFDLVYRYKADNDLRWRFSTSPVYSTYHRGQFDYLKTSSAISVTKLKDQLSYSAGVNNRIISGLINAERSSSSNGFFLETSLRKKLPQLFRPHARQQVLTSITGSFSYTALEADQSPVFSAYNWSAGLSFNQPVAERTALTAGYAYTINENRYAIGTDYAYRSHGLSLRLERGIAAGFVATGGYGVNFINYKNPDSVTIFTRHRHNIQQSLSFGLTYYFHRRMKAFFNVGYVNNNSNLPVGFILSAEDVIEGLQSASLGDYSSTVMSAGISLSL